LAIRGRSRSRSPTPVKKEEEDEELEEKDDLLAIGPAPMIPPGGYTNVRDAEEAFIWLLKKTKVDETWTWDKVMGTIVMDPLYKALGTLAEKKSAFTKVSEQNGVHTRLHRPDPALSIVRQQPDCQQGAHQERPSGPLPPLPPSSDGEKFKAHQILDELPKRRRAIPRGKVLEGSRGRGRASSAV